MSNCFTINGFKKISQSIDNINMVFDKSICKDCYFYIPINNNDIPIHFNCSRIYELLKFPTTINEINSYYDDEGNIHCMSFIEKDKE